ncbi:MAG TPA: hypothetical protein DDY91_13605 [Planctomycetaceae bacterium]|nr:hypothetical protein [Planctomycetaceae bacterium]
MGGTAKTRWPSHALADSIGYDSDHSNRMIPDRRSGCLDEPNRGEAHRRIRCGFFPRHLLQRPFDET